MQSFTKLLFQLSNLMLTICFNAFQLQVLLRQFNTEFLNLSRQLSPISTDRLAMRHARLAQYFQLINNMYTDNSTSQTLHTF